MINRISNNNYNYIQASSVKRTTKAADDAAGLAISKKQEAKITSIIQGTRNLEDGKNMLNVSDGIIGNVMESLQRMRSLALQASNGTLSSGNRESIQVEIDQLKEEISNNLSNSSYNEINPLNNKGISIQSDDVNNLTINRTYLEDLGISDFDVTKDFSLQTIDDAIDKISSVRGNLGADINAIEHTISYNNQASENLTDANSRLADLDMERAIMNIKQQRLLQDIQIQMQKQTIMTPFGVLLDMPNFERRV